MADDDAITGRSTKGGLIGNLMRLVGRDAVVTGGIYRIIRPHSVWCSILRVGASDPASVRRNSVGLSRDENFCGPVSLNANVRDARRSRVDECAA